jgi:hypothetical protein
MDDDELRGRLRRIEIAANIAAAVAFAVAIKWAAGAFQSIIAKGLHWDSDLAALAAILPAVLVVLLFVRWITRGTP